MLGSTVTVSSWVKSGHGRKLNGSQDGLAVAVLAMDKSVDGAGSGEGEVRTRG